MTAEWVPFGLKEDEAERYKVLVDGVPPKLREPIVAWFKHLLSSGDYERLNNARTRHLEMLTEVGMGIPEDVYAKWGEYTKLLREMEAQSLLKSGRCCAFVPVVRHARQGVGRHAQAQQVKVDGRRAVRQAGPGSA